MARNSPHKSHSQDKSCFVRVVLPTECSPHDHSSPMSGEVSRSDGEVSRAKCAELTADCWEDWEDWE
ncbi:MAG: hypothetical protein J6R10_03465, partial [Tidjanibacter sp.]|nr:hypothetical protein [Tidjanibacter sp.]